MAHHKRKRPKDQRAGCLMCKPHKSNGQKHTKGGYGKLTIRDLKLQGDVEEETEEYLNNPYYPFIGPQDDET